MVDFMKIRLSSVGAPTMVVSVMEPKLLIKILQVTFTGGPEKTQTHTHTHTDRKEQR